MGYGYVNFHNVADAEKAIDTLSYSSIKGRSCRIMWSQRDPSMRKSNVANIYVKNLDTKIDNRALYDTFSLFGNILSCKVSSELDGKSRGYGFVHYETEDAAKQAVQRVNGMLIGDKTVEVHMCVKRNERPNPKDNFTNLYVKGLPPDFTNEELKELFTPVGPVTSCTVMEDKEGRKFAFVNYETVEAAKQAVAELPGKDMRTDAEKSEDKELTEERTLFVGRAMTKAERAKELQVTAKSSAQERSSGSGGVNLYVKNLDEEIDDESLRELFEGHGTITSCLAVSDEEGKCKGFGFVCYNSPDEATKAVTEMHLKVVKGKPLYVGLAEKKDARQERLRQRYSPGGKGGKEGKGRGKGGGGGGMGGNRVPSMFGQQAGMAMGAGMPMPGMPMMGGATGPGGMMGPGAQMMGIMGKGGMMMNPMQMMGKGAPMGMMGAKGPMPFDMTGGKGKGAPMGMMGKGAMGMPPPMMGMMGGKAGVPPQMMAMMAGGGKGPMPGAGMPGGMPGMMRPMMPPQGAGGPVQVAGQGLGLHPASAPLTAAALAAAPASVQKQMLGEKLYPAISRYQPELAGKITGMMLEMDNSELLILLESEGQLKQKVDEALRVLQTRQ
jgi:polyadenylate-binding protein